MSAEVEPPAVADVRVRPSAVEDDAALLAIELTSWPPGAGFPSFRQRRLGQTSFFDGDDTPGSHLVAEYRGEVVGYIRVRPASRVPEGSHVFAIFGIVVAERARRLGVATALLRAAEEQARAQGGRKLVLRVLATNPPAQRLYQRHGYVVEGRFAREFLIDGEYVDDYAMAKFLDP